MTFVHFSASNTFLWVVVLSFVAAVRPRANWLIAFIMVLGVVLTAQVARILEGGTPLIDLFDLIASGVSTCLLAWIGVRLIETDSLSARIGFGSVASVQGASIVMGLIKNRDFVSSMPTIDVEMWKHLDGAACFLAALMFAIGLLRHYGDRDGGRGLPIAGFAAAVCWGIFCLPYWFLVQHPMGEPLMRAGLIVGVAATSAISALLILREPSAKMPGAPLAP